MLVANTVQMLVQNSSAMHCIWWYRPDLVHNGSHGGEGLSLAGGASSPASEASQLRSLYVCVCVGVSVRMCA